MNIFPPTNQYSESTALPEMHGPDFEIDPLCTISCTVAVVNSYDTPNGRAVTYDFGPLAIHENYLCDRTGSVRAIHIETLIHALRTSVASDGLPIPQALQCVLGAETVTHIAAVRVPFFGDRWQDTGHGFRMLRSLIPANAAMVLPDAFRNDTMAFAVDPEHSITRAHMRMWAVTGMRPETHFAFAFLPLSLAPAAVALSRNASPAPSLFSAYSQRSASHTPSDYSAAPADIPPTDFGHQLAAATTFAEAADILGLSADDIEKAKFKNPSSKPLPMQVQNWAAAAHVLAKFCVSANDPDHQFPGGFVARFTDILEAIGWSSTTYNKKSKWYQWASRAATQSWHKPSPPDPSDAEDYSFYTTWRGICYLWKQGGPLITGQLPSRTSSDPDERHAAVLTQHAIEIQKTGITLRLI